MEELQEKFDKLALKSLKPLVKWSGGKGDEIKFFEKYIPSNYDTYLEPFAGGASVFFHLNPDKAVINDLHEELIDFYGAIKEEKNKEIYNFMRENKNDEETYYKVRKWEPLTLEEKAMKFYYLRKTCYRGMLRYNKKGKFNVPYGRYKTCNYEILNDTRYSELLKRTIVSKKDYSEIFEEYNDSKNFMFLDPPYDSVFTDYGYCSFGKKEHEKLFSLFKETKIKCLMVIGKTDFIENLYKDYIVEEFDKKYRFKLHSNRIGEEIDNKHLVIKNY